MSKAALNIDYRNYEILRNALVTSVMANEAVLVGTNVEGDVYTVDFELANNPYRATVRTAWILKFDEAFPRLVSCYVKPD